MASGKISGPSPVPLETGDERGTSAPTKPATVGSPYVDSRGVKGRRSDTRASIGNFYLSALRCALLHIVWCSPLEDGGPSCMAMLRCALWAKHADRCMDVVKAISRRDHLRYFFATRRFAWFLIRESYRRWVKAENALSDPAWRNVDGWAELYEGAREKRRLPKRLPAWPSMRPSPRFG